MNILQLSLEELIALRKNYGSVETLDRATTEGRCSLEKLHIFDQIISIIIRENGPVSFFLLSNRWIDDPRLFVDLAGDVFSDLSINVDCFQTSHCPNPMNPTKYCFYLLVVK